MLLVYERRSYLEVALRLLSLCRGVNATTTLVVSHQGTQRDVWELVRSVGFVRVRQLLYPLADHPELHGALALKLHFTWALARTFALLEADEVVYMEDDFWPTPDFYTSALRLRAARELHCPKCVGSVLGDHPRDWHERHRDGAHWLAPARRALLHRHRHSPLAGRGHHGGLQAAGPTRLLQYYTCNACAVLCADRFGVYYLLPAGWPAGCCGATGTWITVPGGALGGTVTSTVPLPFGFAMVRTAPGPIPVPVWRWRGGVGCWP